MVPAAPRPFSSISKAKSSRLAAEATRRPPRDRVWSEQAPDDWWPSTIEAINQTCRTAGVAADTIEGVGLTGQMHGLVALDSSATPIRPAILWNDGRSAPQCQAVEARIGIERLVSLCGNRMLPGFTAPKLLWMREHEPEAYARITTVLLPKDWIRYRLSGELVMDVSDASGTAVFDCANRTWSDELLGELSISHVPGGRTLLKVQRSSHRCMRRRPRRPDFGKACRSWRVPATKRRRRSGPA